MTHVCTVRGFAGLEEGLIILRVGACLCKSRKFPHVHRLFSAPMTFNDESVLTP
ncbi:hypothetical protein M404DRAFT_1004413 [Pisolithus tinctorius Marx 270]|uniref:Uncharacterized protein n=1 Tax=Pisolithus tinctorius Marx 270 TaxID=870435 RepID=A0A0C3NWX2_PISTI|nr:hypothetical protein M404DRAFT_1004413 [Pisolithus tinctorius Marx 270]